MKIPILYQDSDIVVVDKPAGIPTHAPDPRDPYAGDALRIVQAQTGLPYLGMHQRLDADTSGVLLFAARREANRALAAAFEGHAVRKIYLALVHGAPPQDEGAIDAPIAREHGERYRTTTPADPRGLAARTRYRVLDTFALEWSQANDERDTCFVLHENDKPDFTYHGSRLAGNAPRSTLHAAHSPTYSLLELIPETGRPHQIRVHLAHIGCPVVGDPLYGPTDRPAPRLFLHAYQLTLPHPATGEPVTFMRTGGAGDRRRPSPAVCEARTRDQATRTCLEIPTSAMLRAQCADAAAGLRAPCAPGGRSADGHLPAGERCGRWLAGLDCRSLR